MSDPSRWMADRPAATDPDDEAEPRTLLVVDADDRTRESIVGLLRIRRRFEVIGSAGHVGAAVALVREHRPDVVIVDPRLPELPDGITLIRRIRAISPGARILALGWSPELEHDTLEAGADGFLRKTFKPAELSGAIERCIDAGRPSSEGGSPAPAPAAGMIL